LCNSSGIRHFKNKDLENMGRFFKKMKMIFESLENLKVFLEKFHHILNIPKNIFSQKILKFTKNLDQNNLCCHPQVQVFETLLT